MRRTTRQRLRVNIADATAIFELFVKIALIVGGIAAVIQYLDVKREKRVERTLAYAERFEADPIRSARQTMTAIFRDQHRTASNLGNVGIDAEGATVEEHRFVDYLLLEANGVGVEREIDSIVSFIDDVDHCANENLCDEPVVINYFGEFSDQLEKNLHFYIAKMRKNGSPRYAIGLQQMAQRYRALDHT